jgi:hypothetical protein
MCNDLTTSVSVLSPSPSCLLTILIAIRCLVALGTSHETPQRIPLYLYQLNPSLLLFLPVLLLQGTRHAETNRRGARDLDGFAGTGVATCSCSRHFLLECAQFTQTNFVPFGQHLLVHGRRQGGKHILDIIFTHARLFFQYIQKICFT